jgi:hypothetical protein
MDIECEYVENLEEATKTSAMFWLNHELSPTLTLKLRDAVHALHTVGVLSAGEACRIYDSIPV